MRLQYAPVFELEDGGRECSECEMHLRDEEEYHLHLMPFTVPICPDCGNDLKEVNQNDESGHKSSWHCVSHSCGNCARYNNDGIRLNG